MALIDRDEGALRVKATALDEKFPARSSLPVRCDVTDEEQVRARAATVASHFGGIDIMVNAVGGTGPIDTSAQEYPASEFRAIPELNVTGAFPPCRHVLPHLIARGGGCIVNLAGASGLRGYPNRSGYSAPNWAVRGLTRTLAVELGCYDITVNDICLNVTNGTRMDRIIAEKPASSARPPSRSVLGSPPRPRWAGSSAKPTSPRQSASSSLPAPATSPTMTSPSTRAGTSE